MTKPTNGSGDSKPKVHYGPDIDEKKLKKFAASIATLKQDLADATMAHAEEWKTAEKAGIHKAALKHVLKLKKQDAAKTRDFQNHFDAYADILGLNAQLELFDQAREEEARQESVAAASQSAPAPA